MQLTYMTDMHRCSFLIVHFPDHDPQMVFQFHSGEYS